MQVQTLKTAHGYRYRDLHVIDHGNIRSATLGKRRKIWHYGPSTVETIYTITTTTGFKVVTDFHTTMLRGTRNDSVSFYHLLQISTKKGKIFFCVVSQHRIAEIRKKALFFL